MNSEARSSFLFCKLFTGSTCYSPIFVVAIEVFTLGPYKFCRSYLIIKLLGMAGRNFPEQRHEITTWQTYVSPALIQSA